jgi:hypothetical protein
MLKCMPEAGRDRHGEQSEAGWLAALRTGNLYQLFWGGDGVNENGLSRKHILKACELAVPLALEYVDLISATAGRPYLIEETVWR